MMIDRIEPEGSFSRVGEIGSTQLFELGGKTVTVGMSVTVLAIVAISFVAAGLVRAGMMRTFRRKGVESTAFVTARLVHHAVFVVGVIVALDTVGIQLKTLFAASAVFAVGFGFAMQNVAQNFVAGLILLLERSIKVGDVLEVDKEMVLVREMRVRTTLVQTRDDEHLIVPNSILAQSMVKNLTLEDSAFRLGVTVGVDYGSDMKAVRAVLEKVALSPAWRDESRAPLVLLQDFGDSSVVWEVFVWTRDPWLSRVHRAELREAIWFALKSAEITIAFPQVDVHLDVPVVDALRSVGRIGRG